MDLSYRRFLPSEAERLTDWLTREIWPFHVNHVLDRAVVGRWLAEGHFDSESSRTFWITEGIETIGLIRLMDLTDDTPSFDLRVRAEHRGRGVGTHSLTWLTEHLFTGLPQLRRIEGVTRDDNHAMRRTFLRCGYAKEAHYRDAWPDGRHVHDSVGYAILRRDWQSGTVSPVDWADG